MKHLDELGVSYWYHLKFALRIAVIMFIAAILVVVHAIFPNFMPTVATDVVRHLHKTLNEKNDGTTD
jgi:hypothetical protein